MQEPYKYFNIIIIIYFYPELGGSCVRRDEKRREGAIGGKLGVEERR